MENLVASPGGVKSGKESSSVGRNECSHRRQHGCQARPLAEAQDRDVRKPRSSLAPVATERFQSPGEIVGELPRCAVFGQHEHADAAGLPPTEGCQLDRARDGRRPLQSGVQLTERASRRCPEKCEREMQLLAWHDAPSAELLLLPARERVERRLRKAEREEHSKWIISRDRIARDHTTSCRLRVNSATTRV